MERIGENMIKYWMEEIRAKEINLEESRVMWNKRAEEFSGFEADKIPLPFIQKKMSLEGKSVIDIGFGGGRYLAEFAKLGMELYGIELSDNMREHAIQKLKKQGASFDPDNLKRCSWEDIDVEKEQWHQKFDLVFLSFSPAISSYREWEKVLTVAREGIYISSHILRTDSLLEDLCEEFHVVSDQSFIGKLVPLFNLFVEKGYFPDIEFTMEEFERELQLEEVLPRYTHRLFGEDHGEEQKALVREAMNKRIRNSKLLTEGKEVNGYLFVDIRKKR